MIIIFLLFYLLTPILMTPFIIFLLIYSEKYTKIYSFLLSFNIGIIGYYFVPPINFDLFRHFLKLDELSTLSLIDALQYNQSPLVIENLWFYAIALIGDYGLLPLGAITLSYYFVIVITVEYCKSRKISKIYILTAILLILSWYQLINPMSGVRFSTALSLSAYGIYKIYYKNSKLGYIYIYLASFIHIGMSLILLILFLSKLFKKNMLIVLLMIFLSSIFLEFIILFMSFFEINYIAILKYKLEAYIQYKVVGGMNTFMFVFQISWSIVVFFTIILFRKQILAVKQPEGILNFFLILTIILVSFYFIQTIVFRYSLLLLIFFPILFVDLIKGLNSYFKIIGYLVSIVIISIGFIIQYLQLNSLFFNIKMEEFIFVNIFKMFMNLI